MLVDADPQCNLTGYFIGIKEQSDYEEVLQNKNYHNIYSLTAGVLILNRDLTKMRNSFPKIISIFYWEAFEFQNMKAT